MKKVILIPVAIILVVAFLLSGCGTSPSTTPSTTSASTTAPKSTSAPTTAPKSTSTPAAGGPAITLSFATFEAPEANNSVAIKQWVQELDQKTNGRVKVNVGYSEVMAKAAQEYDAAVSGVVDMAMVGISYTPGRFQMAPVWFMPIREVPNTVANEALYQLLQKGYFDQDYKDVKVLFMAVDNAQQIFVSKKEYKTLDDFKGQKIRAAGKEATDMIQNLGAAPVGIPAPDVYDSMSKGVVDAAFAPYGFVNAFRIQTVTKSATEIGLGGMEFVWVMNKDKWNSLPKDIQQTIDQMSPNYSKITGDLATQWRELGKKLITDTGAPINVLSAADQAKLNAAEKPMWDAWISEGNSKGLKRQQMADDLYNILTSKGIKDPFAGYTPTGK